MNFRLARCLFLLGLADPLANIGQTGERDNWELVFVDEILPFRCCILELIFERWFGMVGIERVVRKIIQVRQIFAFLYLVLMQENESNFRDQRFVKWGLSMQKFPRSNWSNPTREGLVE